MTHDELLAFYAKPGMFTSVGGFGKQIDRVPDDPGSVAKFVQGLLIHEALAPAYQVTLSPERRAMKELHGAEAMLAHAAHLDDAPLGEGRAPDRRVAGVCRHFATLFVAVMRHKGAPARARCGFANYFERGKHVDHWLGEYWNTTEQRWVLVDAQVDGPQKDFFKPDFDLLDVPRDRFLVAGDAWIACRSGAADPMTFGVGGTEMWGLVEVMGDLMQDVAALQSIELLPWGWYGLARDGAACEREPEVFDRLAALSSRADAAALDAICEAIDAAPRLRVPAETLATIAAADREAISRLDAR